MLTFMSLLMIIWFLLVLFTCFIRIRAAFMVDSDYVCTIACICLLTLNLEYSMQKPEIFI